MKEIEYLEREINKFFVFLGEKDTIEMIKLMFEVFELYDVDDDEGWLAECLEKDDIHNVRVIRTAYLLSKLADLYVGKLLIIKTQFKGLWKRLEESQNDKKID